MYGVQVLPYFLLLFMKYLLMIKTEQLKEHIVSDNFTFPSFKERLKGNYDYSFVYSLITDCLVKDPNIRFDSKKLMKKYFENFATSVD